MSATGPRGRPPVRTIRFADSELLPSQKKLPPPSGVLANGFTAGQRPPAPWFNYFMQNLGALADHLLYLQLENLSSRSNLAGEFDGELSCVRVLFDDSAEVPGLPVGLPRSSVPGEDFLETVVLGHEGNNAIWISHDGINGHYFEKTNATADHITDCVWSNHTAPSILVVVGPGGIQSATNIFDPTDAAPFTASAIADDMEAVVVGYPAGVRTFCAVGNGGEIYTSTNGTTWAAQVNPDASRPLKGITWDQRNLQFVIVGYATATVLPIIMTSPDAVTWTIRAGISDTDYTGLNPGLHSVVYGEIVTDLGDVLRDVLVAVGEHDSATGVGLNQIVILFSEDAGVTWERVFNPPIRSLDGSGKLSDVRFINGRFVAVGTSMSSPVGGLGRRGEIMSSFDGESWRAHQSERGSRENAGGNDLMVDDIEFLKLDGCGSGIIIGASFDEIGDVNEAGIYISLLT